MNSFESDLWRAIFSKGFLAAVLLRLAILIADGPESDLFKMSIPLICTLPYSAAWLDEYRHGFVKLALSRSSFGGYIFGKFLATGASAGLAELLGMSLFSTLNSPEMPPPDNTLLFLSAFLWATVAATLAAASQSKHIAYGASFVIYHFLVILSERYFKRLYCLNPHEWTSPKHTWIFDESGVALMLSAFIALTAIVFYITIRRKLQRA